MFFEKSCFYLGNKKLFSWKGHFFFSSKKFDLIENAKMNLDLEKIIKLSSLMKNSSYNRKNRKQIINTIKCSICT